MYLKLFLEQLFMGQKKREISCCNNMKEEKKKILWEPQGNISYCVCMSKRSARGRESLEVRSLSKTITKALFSILDQINTEYIEMFEYNHSIKTFKRLTLNGNSVRRAHNR